MESIEKSRPVSLKPTVPENGAVVLLQSESQLLFRENHIEMTAAAEHSENKRIDWKNLTHTGEEDRTLPIPVVFSWEGGEATLAVSDSCDIKRNVYCSTSESPCEVYNLEIGKTYYWRVSRANESSEIRSFSTDDIAPRWIIIDGIPNVRDVGGWHCEDGRRMRQGMLYRGSEFDSHCEITEAGIKTVTEVLGLTTELDLRAEAVGKLTSSPAGDDINYKLIPLAAYTEFLECKTALAEIFDLLADRRNYPVYFHCWGGADRTGSLAFIIQALCGVSEEDMFLDYEMTSLSVWGPRSSRRVNFSEFLTALKQYGDDWKSRARAFLIECGINEKTLDAVVDNLTEK